MDIFGSIYITYWFAMHMQWRKYILLVLALVPLSGYGFVSQIQDTITRDSSLNENYYALGKDILVHTHIGWDSFLVWMNVLSQGSVSGDMSVVAWDAYVNGFIQNDLRVIAASMQLSGVVTGDVLVAWGQIVFDKQSIIHGTTAILWSQVQLDWSIYGDTTIHAAKLIINWVVYGTATFQAQEIIWWSGAKVVGSIITGDVKEFVWTTKSVSDSFPWIEIVWLFFIAWILISLVSKKLPSFIQNTQNKLLSSFFFGVVIYLLTPIIVFLFLVSQFLYLLWVVWLMIYIALLLFAKTVCVVYISSILNIHFLKKNSQQKYILMMILAIVSVIVAYIPFGLAMVLSSVVYGAIVRMISSRK